MGWPGGSWEATIVLLVVITLSYLAVLWVTLVAWTYRDIRARTDDSALQLASVLVVLFFGFAGLVVYLILRPRITLMELESRMLEEEALRAEMREPAICENCASPIEADFMVCPRCSTRLREPCVACSRPVKRSWSTCPYCGVAVAAAAKRPARPRPAPPAPAATTERPRQISALPDDRPVAREPHR